MRPKFVEGWSVFLRGAWSNWAQFGQAALGLLTFIDPATMLSVWLMMPDHIRERVPLGFVQNVGAVLFTMALVTITLRLMAQPRMGAKVAAKIEEKQNVDA